MTLAHKVGVQRENLATMDVDAKELKNVAKDKTVELVAKKRVLVVSLTEQVVVLVERAEFVVALDVVK